LLSHLPHREEERSFPSPPPLLIPPKPPGFASPLGAQGCDSPQAGVGGGEAKLLFPPFPPSLLLPGFTLFFFIFIYFYLFFFLKKKRE
jgi:hypothetical protein